jgi:hypothetical protein
LQDHGRAEHLGEFGRIGVIGQDAHVGQVGAMDRRRVQINPQIAARHLACLYTKSFVGKPNGRFRLSSKQLRELLGRKRIYPDDIEKLSRAAFEIGFVLIDMDSFSSHSAPMRS